MPIVEQIHTELNYQYEMLTSWLQQCVAKYALHTQEQQEYKQVYCTA